MFPRPLHVAKEFRQAIMLGVIIHINGNPIYALGARRVSPRNAKKGVLCEYETSTGERLTNKFDPAKGALLLAIKMIRNEISRRS